MSSTNLTYAYLLQSKFFCSATDEDSKRVNSLFIRRFSTASERALASVSTKKKRADDVLSSESSFDLSRVNLVFNFSLAKMEFHTFAVAAAWVYWLNPVECVSQSSVWNCGILREEIDDEPPHSTFCCVEYKRKQTFEFSLFPNGIGEGKKTGRRWRMRKKGSAKEKARTVFDTFVYIFAQNVQFLIHSGQRKRQLRFTTDPAVPKHLHCSLTSHCRSQTLCYAYYLQTWVDASQRLFM